MESIHIRNKWSVYRKARIVVGGKEREKNFSSGLRVGYVEVSVEWEIHINVSHSVVSVFNSFFFSFSLSHCRPIVFDVAQPL